MMNIKINYLTYFYLFILFLSGKILDGMIIFLIIFIHECGHLLIAKIYNYEVKEMILYPFGGLLKLNKKINTKPIEDLLLSLGGIVFQLLLQVLFYILLLNGIIRLNTYNIFNEYNKLIFLFNLLPMIPLDGSNIIDSLLNIFLPFKKSYILNFYISIFILITFIFYNYYNSLSGYLIISFLLTKLYSYYKNKDYILNKFFVERYLYNQKYSKIVNCKSKDVNLLRKNTYFFFWDKDKWANEKKILENNYFKGRKH